MTDPLLPFFHFDGCDFQTVGQNGPLRLGSMSPDKNVIPNVPAGLENVTGSFCLVDHRLNVEFRAVGQEAPVNHLSIPNRPVFYTGALLIATDPVKQRLHHSDALPWHFTKVIKLRFETGELMDITDLSRVFVAFNLRYCADGVFSTAQRRNGLRYLERHIGKGFKF